MSIKAIGDPLRESCSYLAPHIEIDCNEGAVSIMMKTANLVYSHVSFLIESVDEEKKPHHILYTLNGGMDIGITMSTYAVKKVSNAAVSVVQTTSNYNTEKIETLSNIVAGAIYGTTHYGTTEMEKFCFENYSDFSYDVRTQGVNAFSLWKVPQANIKKLVSSLDATSLNPPPFSITGHGKEDGQRAYHCFTFAQEELEKIGIKAKNSSWLTLSGWIPVVKNFADAHIGKIKGAACNCIGLPPHLK